MKLALIGCSFIAEKHRAALAEMSDITVTAVCDIDAARAATVAKELHSTAYTDYAKLLKEADIDAVSICTPSHLHADMAIAAAQAGKHVLTEKPMALSSEDAAAMVQAAKKHGTQLGVVLQYRFKPTVQLVKQALDQGRLGKVFLGTITVYWSRPQSYFDEAPWRGKKDFNGGMLFNQVSHHLDILQWYMGPVKRVTSMVDTMLHKIETDDIALALVEFESGAYGVIQATINTYPKNLEGSLTLLGETGSVKLGGTMMDQVALWDLADVTDAEKKNIQAIHAQQEEPYAGHLAVYRDFLDAVQSNRAPVADGTVGLTNIQLIEKIYAI